MIFKTPNSTEATQKIEEELKDHLNFLLNFSKPNKSQKVIIIFSHSDLLKGNKTKKTEIFKQLNLQIEQFTQEFKDRIEILQINPNFSKINPLSNTKFFSKRFSFFREKLKEKLESNKSEDTNSTLFYHSFFKNFMISPIFSNFHYLIMAKQNFNLFAHFYILFCNVEKKTLISFEELNNLFELMSNQNSILSQFDSFKPICPSSCSKFNPNDFKNSKKTTFNTKNKSLSSSMKIEKSSLSEEKNPTTETKDDITQEKKEELENVIKYAIEEMYKKMFEKSKILGFGENFHVPNSQDENKLMFYYIWDFKWLSNLFSNLVSISKSEGFVSNSDNYKKYDWIKIWPTLRDYVFFNFISLKNGNKIMELTKQFLSDFGFVLFVDEEEKFFVFPHQFSSSSPPLFLLSGKRDYQKTQTDKGDNFIPDFNNFLNKLHLPNKTEEIESRDEKNQVHDTKEKIIDQKTGEISKKITLIFQKHQDSLIKWIKMVLFLRTRKLFVGDYFEKLKRFPVEEDSIWENGIKIKLSCIQISLEFEKYFCFKVSVWDSNEKSLSENCSNQTLAEDLISLYVDSTKKYFSLFLPSVSFKFDEQN